MFLLRRWNPKRSRVSESGPFAAKGSKGAASSRSNDGWWPTFGIAYMFGVDGRAFEGVLTRLSPAGAVLKIDADADLPSEPEVWLPSEAIRSSARIAWRRGHLVGVSFLDPKAQETLIAKADASGRPKDRRSAMIDALRGT